MKNYLISLLFVLLFTSVSCTTVQSPESQNVASQGTVLPLSIEDLGYAITFDVYFKAPNALFPVNFTIDTGASGINLSVEDFEYLKKTGLKFTLERKIKVHIASGEVIEVPYYKIDNIIVGTCLYKPAYVTVLGNTSLFGLVLLRDMGPMKIDFEKKIMELTCHD